MNPHTTTTSSQRPQRLCGEYPRRNLRAPLLLTLALALGPNIAIFSALEATLLRPLPYPAPARLAVLWESNPKLEGFLAQRLPVAGLNLSLWQTRLHSFDAIESLRHSCETLTGLDAPQTVTVARVSPGLFRLLGASVPTPANGAILSAAFFAETLHSNPRALSRSLVLNGVPYPIAAVLPAAFRLPALWQGREQIRPDIFLPSLPDLDPPAAGLARRNYVFARLRPNVTLESARAELSALALHLQREFPRLDAGFSVTAFPMSVEDADPGARRAIAALQAAAFFILLIACANIANLQLAQASRQARDHAIRAALGASPLRLFQNAFARSVLISAQGAALSLVFARALLAALNHLAPPSAFRLQRLSLNLPVLAFACALTLLSAILFGFAPALAACRPNLRLTIASGSPSSRPRSASRLRNTLAAVQIALALIALTGAGVMLHSLARILQTPPGFNPSRMLTFRLALTPSRYRTPQQVQQFCGTLLVALSALPGVRDAAISTSLPLGDALSLAPYRLAGDPEPPPGRQTMADFKGVSETYFRLTQTPLLRGRDFTLADSIADSPRAVILNQALASQLSHGHPGDLIGRALLIGTGPKIIIGIAAGTRQTGLDSPSRPEMFLPTRSIAALTILLRTTADPLAAAAPAAAAIHALDPDLPLSNLRSMDRQLQLSAAPRTFAAALFALFSALALSLAAFGLYSVLSHSVAARTRELGLRLALGAPPAAIRRLVLRSALRIASLGIAAGALGALILARAFHSLFPDLTAPDPLVFLSAAALLLAVSALATWRPAARAASVDPAISLRSQ